MFGTIEKTSGDPLLDTVQKALREHRQAMETQAQLEKVRQYLSQPDVGVKIDLNLSFQFRGTVEQVAEQYCQADPDFRAQLVGPDGDRLREAIQETLQDGQYPEDHCHISLPIPLTLCRDIMAVVEKVAPRPDPSAAVAALRALADDIAKG